MRVVTFLVLAATFLMPSNLFGQDDNKVVTVDHFIPHTSKVPANATDVVQLFVRERFVCQRIRGSDDC